MDVNSVGREGPPVVIAYYVTGHGLGHATRVAEVCKQLLHEGHEVYVVSGAPEWVFRLDLNTAQMMRLHYRNVVLDNGAKQLDALSVDRVGSLEEYFRSSVEPRDTLLHKEVNWMQSAEIDVVVSDIVPLACAAAEQANIPCVCVTNFSWDFVYAEYLTEAGTQQKHLQRIVWQIAEDYSKANLLLRLPGHTPMPAFHDVMDVGLVCRKARLTREQVRQELGLTSDIKLVLYQFGGQDANWSLDSASLPLGWACVVASHMKSPGTLPPNFIHAQQNAYTPDLVQAADCVLGKIGYGTASESLAHGIPLVFVRRSYFNEEPFLRKLLEINNCAVEMTRRDFFNGNWAPYLERALQLTPSYNADPDAVQKVATSVISLARGENTTKCRQSGQVRLRDAVVFGYHLARSHSLADNRMMEEVPSWYTEGQTPTSLELPPPSVPATLQDAVKIKHGSTGGLADTEMFLHHLVELRAQGAQDLRHERRAAAGLFRWNDDIVITRAPGRLDVLGGIADYSGSLVLEMPIQEACHVALQRQACHDQPSWKHTQERHKRYGTKDLSTLRIVSYGGEATDRAPAFDMDLQDFYDHAGEPITYEEAKTFFKQDVSRNWAAYIAGTLLVLMREKGIRFKDGISILVHSEVPEGKGVSSSAAVEVGAMTAITAAYAIQMQPLELALLCQKVENLVVGAPCGAMDQITSMCGEQGKLLALLCRPSEILGHVTIPAHMQFWGIDSGIRHSVGGSDYGSVRVGAFMGNEFITQMRLSDHEQGESTPDKAAGMEQSRNYLAAIAPHEYERSFKDRLPETIDGSAFIKQLGTHADPVTTISSTQTYAVRGPTQHPIYENFRVEMFKELMRGPKSDQQMRLLGELMYQAHVSYSQCGLGSSGTDRLVSLVQQTPTSGELYGAKITGGGSGGTVCVFGRRGTSANKAVQSILAQYEQATQHTPHVFHGSSPGAHQFGHLIVKLV